MNARLETLREKMTCSWGELQKALGVSESTLYFLRKGARNPSPKLLRRMIALEHQAGIAPAVFPGAGVREHPGEYRVENTGKEVNKLEAFQEIKRIRESLAKLEKLLGGGDNE